MIQWSGIKILLTIDSVERNESRDRLTIVCHIDDMHCKGIYSEAIE